MTVRALLKLPAMQRGAPEVLSGTEALDRPVRWVHASEVPNIASLLKGREVLLITGMGLADTERACRQFIDDLADRDTAALAIQLGSTWPAVPAAMLDQARLRDLPLVALHRELPFVEVTEAAQQAILNHQDLLRRHGDELHRQFTELILGGAGIPEILQALAEVVANPVVLEKAGGGIAYHAVHHASDATDATVMGALEACRRGATGEGEAIERAVPAGRGDRWGALFTFELDTLLNDFDTVAIESAVGVIGLALKQQREEAALTMRERGVFLERVLTRKIDDAEASIRAKALGFPRRMGPILTMAVASTGSPFSSVAIHESTWALVWRDVRETFAMRGRPLLIGGRGDGSVTLALVALARSGDRVKEADAAAEAVERAAKQRFGTPASPVIAVGRVAHTWEEVRASLREAEDTALAAGSGPRRAWHDVMRPDVDRLLWSLRDQPALRAFVRARLEPLVDHDRTGKSQLLPTLRAYCEHGGRKSDAARALLVERQTLYYRLARIEKLLAVDLSDGDALLSLHLAVRAQAYVTGDGA